VIETAVLAPVLPAESLAVTITCEVTLELVAFTGVPVIRPAFVPD
jgi:hypothetical protein